MQALGAFIRYISCLGFSIEAEVNLVFIGQVLAATAMPFMVNSPPLLSANWFQSTERAVATSIAVNCNALGIAFVYMVAPFTVHTVDDIANWNLLITIATVVAAILGAIYFRSFPIGVDSRSPNSIEQLKDEYNWHQWIR